MKKCRTSILVWSQTAWLLKFLRIMKLTTFIFLIGTIQVFATGSYAQDTDLTLNLGETNVGEVLSEIENQSEFYFLFNQKLVDTERKVKVEVREKKMCGSDDGIGQISRRGGERAQRRLRDRRDGEGRHEGYLGRAGTDRTGRRSLWDPTGSNPSRPSSPSPLADRT